MTGLLNPFWGEPDWAREFGTTFASVAAGNITLQLPPGGPGQLLIAPIGYRGSPTFTAPAGWNIAEQVSTADTSVGTQTSGMLAWRIRQAGDTNPTFTRSGGDRAQGWMLGYTPIRGASPLTVSGLNAQAVASTMISHPGLILPTSNALLVCLAVLAGNTGAASSTFSAANIAALPPPGALVSAPPTVMRWGQAFFVGNTNCTTQFFELVGAPAGNTGLISGTTPISSRGLVIAASFARQGT